MHVLCSVTRCNSKNLDSILQSCFGLRVQQVIPACTNHAILPSLCARCSTATESLTNLHVQSTPLLSHASVAYSFFIIPFPVGRGSCSLSCLIADCQKRKFPFFRVHDFTHLFSNKEYVIQYPMLCQRGYPFASVQWSHLASSCLDAHRGPSGS